jgi:predicted nucleotidyltransferase component of viral defense system
MPKQIRDHGASIRARLLNLANSRNQQFQLVLTRYVLERFLYRLSLTAHRERFILKGAMLIATWFANPHRSTEDVDFLGVGDSDPEGMQNIFREICAIEAEDGVVFSLPDMRIDRIREGMAYGGLRLRVPASVGGARVPVVVDIGFGDAVEPGIEEIELPVLLEQPAARLRAYAQETVIAEKFQAMVMFGRANSRMKDYYDMWVLARDHAFDNGRMARAIAATFQRRTTDIPVARPDALSPAFAEDTEKRRQWSAFARDIDVAVPPLEKVVDDLASFLMPHAEAARQLAVKGG